MIYQTSRRTFNQRLIAIILAIILGIVALGYFQAQDDSDCLEWGVIKRNNATRGESWAPIHTVPRTREDAERIARELESQELTGQYDYEVRCKKWKD